MELSRLALGLILISVLSFARAQDKCPPFNVSELGATDMLTSGGLIRYAIAAVSGDPSALSVQVHDSNIVCLRNGRTRDMYSGVSVVVSYTCTGTHSECTGNPILSQFEFECVTGPTWTASVGGSASNVITTPPSGTLSTTLRTDCGVCVSPARSGFATITNNEQHCGSCNSACSTTQPNLMRCFSRLDSGCCNFFVNNMCVASCPSPLVPNSRFDCVVSCGSVPDLNNGRVIYNSQGQDGTLVGATVTYTCDTGYTLSGSMMRTCQANGTWTDSNPTCNMIICVPPCMNGRCVNGRCTNCPEGRFGVNCTGRCSSMDPACRVCVNGTARFECVRCEDGSLLDPTSNQCQHAIDPNSGLRHAAIITLVIAVALTSIFIMV